jgi:hypothetical protein
VTLTVSPPPTTIVNGNAGKGAAEFELVAGCVKVDDDAVF